MGIKNENSFEIKRVFTHAPQLSSFRIVLKGGDWQTLKCIYKILFKFGVRPAHQ